MAEAWAGSSAVAEAWAGSLAVAGAEAWAEALESDFREPGHGWARHFLGGSTLQASRVPQKGDISAEAWSEAWAWA